MRAHMVTFENSCNNNIICELTEWKEHQTFSEVWNSDLTE